MLSKVAKWGLGAFTNILKTFLLNVIEAFSSFINDMFSMSSSIIDGEYATKLTSYCFKLGLAMLVISGLMQIIKLYLLPDSGEVEDNPGGYFIRFTKATIIMCCSTQICAIVNNISSKLANDFLIIVSKSDTSSLSQSLIDEIGSISIDSPALGTIAIFMIIVISFLVILFQIGIRAINLVILQIVAPLFSVNYLTTDKALFNKWLQNLCSVSLTYVMQIVCLNIGMRFIVDGIDVMLNLLVGACWLIVTIQSPKVLKEFAYSTGTNGGAKGVASTVGRMIIFKH